MRLATTLSFGGRVKEPHAHSCLQAARGLLTPDSFGQGWRISKSEGHKCCLSFSATSGVAAKASHVSPNIWWFARPQRGSFWFWGRLQAARGLLTCFSCLGLSCCASQSGGDG